MVGKKTSNKKEDKKTTAVEQLKAKLDSQKKGEEKKEIVEKEPEPIYPFERMKHRLLQTANLSKSNPQLSNDTAIVDLGEHKYLGRKYSRTEYITLVKVGRAREVEIKRVNSEILEVSEEINGETVTKQYFQHVNPIRLYKEDGSEKIMHFAYEDEPFTRDWFTMRPIDDEKKWNKLLEIGCVVMDTDLENLVRYFSVIDINRTDPKDKNKPLVLYGEKEIRRDLYKQSPTGFLFKPEWAGYDMYGQPRKIYDISDIDAIKEEIFKVMETELVKGYSEAVMVDPYARANRQTEFLVIIFCLTNILLAAVIVIWT